MDALGHTLMPLFKCFHLCFLPGETKLLQVCVDDLPGFQIGGPCFVLFGFVLYSLVLSCLVLFGPVLYSLVLSCTLWSCLVLWYLSVQCMVLTCQLIYIFRKMICRVLFSIDFFGSFFVYLFLYQQDYKKKAGLICMKFSGKVWSDHEMT